MTRNIAASVRQRLRNLARDRGEDFQYILIRYGLERLLYRLGQSESQDSFVLKGAALFALWSDQPHRATRDIDLLGHGDNSIPHMEQLFRQLCDMDVEDDGLVFDAGSVLGQVIKTEEKYEGVRISLTATLERARIPIQVDIGFGDVVTPAPTKVEYPVLLDFPPPRLAAYPKETVVAEKFQAIIGLGMGNSRMKDFHDLAVIGREFSFDGELLANAIEATFERRRTELPNETPLALTEKFYNDPTKQTQWRAFINRIQAYRTDSSAGLSEICGFLRGFLLPPTQARRRGDTFGVKWPAGGPWE
jgi:predicted nucleotidyltransferase component of viral defense system